MSVKSQLVSLWLEKYVFSLHVLNKNDNIINMLGTEQFLKHTKINSQQEKPICPNCKNKFLQDTKNCQSTKITSRKNFVPHGILLEYKIYVCDVLLYWGNFA